MIPIPKKAIPNKGTLKSLKTIKNVSGKARMNMEPDCRKMSRELSRLLQKAQPLEEECAKICKEMNSHLKGVESCLSKLTEVTLELRDCYKHAATKFSFNDFEDMSEIYTSLHSTFTEWTDVCSKNNDNFFRNIRMLFTFSNYEEKGLEEVTLLN